MPILGDSSKPGAGYHSFGGNTYPNQEAEDVALPSRRIRITKLGAWIGGWSANCRVTLTLWDPASGAVLAQSLAFTVANEGVPANGNVAQYVADLVTPYETPVAGGLIRVGFTRDRNDAHQVSTGSTTNGHYHGRGAYPAGGFASIDGTTEPRRIGMYVADYVPLAGAWVYRGGVWQQADAVNVYRSGSWAEAANVAVQRSGAWVDAD